MPASTTGRPAAEFDDVLLAVLPRLRSRVRRWLRHDPRIDADDVVHDVIERALNHRDDIDPRKLLAWCTKTARNRISDLYRRGDDSRQIPTADMAGPCDASGLTSPDPADFVTTAETVTAVRAAVSQLPERYRVLLEAATYRDLGHQAIADENALTVDQVNMALYRARQKLKDTLGPWCRSAGVPFLLVHRTRGTRRVIWPHRLPASVAAGGAMVVTLTAVLQYTLPLHRDPLKVTDAPLPAPIAEAFRRSHVTGTPPSVVTSERSRRTPAPPRDAPQPPIPSEPSDPPLRGNRICRVSCLVPEIATAEAENGDKVTVNVPPAVAEVTGPVSHRQGYVPVCDTWVPNPAARCERHGDPNWVVSPPPRPS